MKLFFFLLVSVLFSSKIQLQDQLEQKLKEALQNYLHSKDNTQVQKRKLPKQSLPDMTRHKPFSTSRSSSSSFSYSSGSGLKPKGFFREMNEKVGPDGLRHVTEFDKNIESDQDLKELQQAFPQQGLMNPLFGSDNPRRKTSKTASFFRDFNEEQPSFQPLFVRPFFNLPAPFSFKQAPQADAKASADRKLANTTEKKD